MTDPIQQIREALTRIMGEMRSERPRYKSHPLGFVDSVRADAVDDWADELDSLLALLASASGARTCATCKHWTHQTSIWGDCARSISQSKYIQGATLDDFGCALHEAVPASADEQKET